MERVLLLEDDPISGKLTSRVLSKYGFEVTWVKNGDLFFRALQTDTPNIAIVDNVPGQSCFQTCSALHQQKSTFSGLTVVYSGNEEEADIISLLELGADDYVTKSFSARVLVARIRSLLRRNPTTPERKRKDVEWGKLRLSPSEKKILMDEEALHTTQSEFELLYLLTSSPSTIYSRAEIIQALHGKNYSVTRRTIDVFIASLRKKLGSYGETIKTVRGVGYQFQPPLSERTSYQQHC